MKKRSSALSQSECIAVSPFHLFTFSPFSPFHPFTLSPFSPFYFLAKNEALAKPSISLTCRTVYRLVRKSAFAPKHYALPYPIAGEAAARPAHHGRKVFRRYAHLAGVKRYAALPGVVALHQVEEPLEQLLPAAHRLAARAAFLVITYPLVTVTEQHLHVYADDVTMSRCKM